jgi:hypothetical protein
MAKIIDARYKMQAKQAKKKPAAKKDAKSRARFDDGMILLDENVAGPMPSLQAQTKRILSTSSRPARSMWRRR